MPQQVPRLLAVFAVVIVALIVARRTLTPPSFGEVGHYRAVAVDSIAARPLKYAGRRACAACHPPVVELHAGGNHAGVSCEVCHGPAAAHVAAPLDTKPAIARDRALCERCHAFNPSRPLGFAQIDTVVHNPRLPCIGCHRPHAPEPPIPPQDCSACHGQLARQKAMSRHATLACETCHETPVEHRTNPRAVRPAKPANRAFCGQCHASPDTGAPQVDLRRHGQNYVCWQCHYPHYPEAN